MFIGHLDEDEISNKSYGSHKNRFKDESHNGSADMLDEHEEKRDASKEELGIGDGKSLDSRGKNINATSFRNGRRSLRQRKTFER